MKNEYFLDIYDNTLEINDALHRLLADSEPLTFQDAVEDKR